MDAAQRAADAPADEQVAALRSALDELALAALNLQVPATAGDADDTDVEL